ncbi:MAG: choice-of-anchor D domain-containing protein [Myxococcaceae bacterium]|nr:choice-of-anchor D domain-containing protein [Myxococcaceae bacterium]
MKRVFLMGLAVAGAFACDRPDTNVQMTSRGELKLTLPDAGMPAFEASHAFGSVKKGESATVSFQAVNTGEDALDIRSVKIDTAAGDTGVFFVSGGTGSVNVGVSRTYSVTFNPVREGAYTGTLVFETNSNSERARLSLTGTGAP